MIITTIPHDTTMFYQRLQECPLDSLVDMRPRGNLLLPVETKGLKGKWNGQSTSRLELGKSANGSRLIRSGEIKGPLRKECGTYKMKRGKKRKIESSVMRRRRSSKRRLRSARRSSPKRRKKSVKKD